MRLPKQLLCTIAAAIFFSIPVIAQDPQEAAIKKTVEDQLVFALKRDVESWKALHTQDDKMTKIIVNLSGSEVKLGWTKYAEGVLKYLADYPEPEALKVETDSFMIRREGNLAVADYKLTITSPAAPPPFNTSISREQRILVKKNGKWLISGSTSVETRMAGAIGIELSLNDLGYTYLAESKNEEAIKVLALNSELFPGSFNVWDSLGEAYLKAGNKEKAKECYQKSLVINPESETGKKALEQLK